MSDSEDFYGFTPLKLTKYVGSEEKKIVLDPAVTLAQRQKDAELDIKIAELTKDAESLSFKHVSSSCDSSIEAFVQKLHQPTVQEIKSSHPCRTTFIPKEFSCLFNQDSLNIQDFQVPHRRFTHSLHQMSSPELHECICRYELKLPSLSNEVRHPLCEYLFLLMSVHRDERTVHACAVTLHCIKGNWYPSFDIIFIIFINWGISSEFLDVYDIEKNRNYPLKLKKVVSNVRFPDSNVEKVLEFIFSVAPALSKNSSEDKFNKLVQVLVLSALDEGFRSPVLQSCFSRCIGALLNAIPESQWNENRVQAVCQVLHRDGMEHFHNQAVVCCSLLTLSPHATEIAKALVFATLNHILAAELKTKPLDNVANTNIFALLKYYEPMNELNCYVLYIVITLVNFCLLRAHVEDNLNLEHLTYMVSWLSNLGGRISTAIDSIDTTVMKELISRCLSNWRIMKIDRTYVQLTCGDEPASLSSDIKE